MEEEERRETLADASEKDVERLLNRARKRSGSKQPGTDTDSAAKRRIWDSSKAVCGAPAAVAQSRQEIALARERNGAAGSSKNEDAGAQGAEEEEEEDDDGIEWEVGAKSKSLQSLSNGLVIQVEGDVAAVAAKKKIARRANARDKEFAELVHKLHLLCLLVRGRMVDAACDDTLLKGMVYSLIPAGLASSINPEKSTAATLTPLVRWLNSVMHIEIGSASGPLSELTKVLSKQSGSEEEVAAITVAMFRSLSFKTRYVRVLDVTPIKPDAESMLASENWGASAQDSGTRSTRSFPEFAAREIPAPEAGNYDISPSQHPQSPGMPSEEDSPDPSPRPQSSSKKRNPAQGSKPGSSSAGEENPAAASESALKRKRKGDEEFELELARAMAATGAAVVEKTPPPKPNQTKAKLPTPLVWSRRRGPLLHWAEVFCGDESTGRWIHVDAARHLVDDVEKIEASSKQAVRYVVGFAGSGAKDVTRRYTTSWSKIQALRVDEGWWNSCLAPLKRLEANAYSSDPHLDEERNAREDMELDVKSFTEPLPTNQQAYRNHHLYVMERWLTRYQILHPKGPVLGSCGGKPVYPRTCVQDLHTKERWLREGFAVRQGEKPVKIIKSRAVSRRVEDRFGVPEEPMLVDLFGKWQTDPWQPPPAVDGIVPKNERGNVAVWSEKCIPPGTVHLRFPRLIPVVQMLGLDFAPAMVGFEIRQGRSVPVFEGVVVCEEFQDAILEVYHAEEERRATQLRERAQAQAGLRWRQLLRSMVTRERLRATYQEREAKEIPPAAVAANAAANAAAEVGAGDEENEDDRPSRRSRSLNSVMPDDKHVHSFPEERQSYDAETSIRTKRCGCGFELRVEEM